MKFSTTHSLSLFPHSLRLTTSIRASILILSYLTQKPERTISSTMAKKESKSAAPAVAAKKNADAKASKSKSVTAPAPVEKASKVSERFAFPAYL